MLSRQFSVERFGEPNHTVARQETRAAGFPLQGSCDWLRILGTCFPAPGLGMKNGGGERATTFAKDFSE